MKQLRPKAEPPVCVTQNYGRFAYFVLNNHCIKQLIHQLDVLSTIRRRIESRRRQTDGRRNDPLPLLNTLVSTLCA